jgi:hypothetical protein
MILNTHKPSRVSTLLLGVAVVAFFALDHGCTASHREIDVPSQTTTPAADSDPLRPLFQAIGHVESNNKDDAVGDGGKALGRYQIHRIYWQDSRQPGKYEDVRDRAYAERVMLAYWRRHVPKALEANDFETLARVHNGGPRGSTKKVTLPYWRKVQEQLKKGNP